MTVSSEIRRQDYAGNDSTTNFATGFRFLQNEDLRVLKTVDATGSETVLVLNSDYTVVGAGLDAGGTVTTTIAPATGETLTILRSVKLTQETDYVENDDFPAESHEEALDKLTMIIQQQQEEQDRALVLAESVSGVNTALPAPSALKFFRWNAAADALELAEGTTSVVSGDVVYNQGDTGAVNSNVENKLQEVISVLDFGGTVPGIITLNVPADHADISAAFTYLRDKRIAEGTTVLIQVADGSYNYTAGVNMNHKDGASIQVKGNTSTPGNVTITFPNSFGSVDGFTVSNGHTIGLFDGFKINKTAKATSSDVGTALLANNGATLILGANIEIDNWYYGAAARNGSFGMFDGISVDNAGDVGIWSFVGSTVSARNAASNNAIDAPNLGFGLQAEYGSAMDCEGASATGCQIGGIASLSNSNVRAISATTNSNIGSGLFVRDGATIEAHSATSNSNTRYGVEEIANGRVFGSGITATSNTIGDFSPRAFFDNGSGNGARVAASDGPLRLDNNGTDAIFFNTSGGLQAEIFHSANVANRPALTGSPSGSAARFLVTGSDTNIDLALEPKGTGQLRWGVHAGGSITANGYVEWKLADGATVRVAAERL